MADLTTPTLAVAATSCLLSGAQWFSAHMKGRKGNRESRSQFGRLETELSELNVKLTTVATVVGIDNDNGLRGSLAELRRDVKQLQRDALIRADRRLKRDEESDPG